MNHSPGLRWSYVTACVIAVVSIAGCVNSRERDVVAPLPPPSIGADAGGREARERVLQKEWIGRTRAELIGRFGPPALVMVVPGSRLPESAILVYRNNDSETGCIDAFVVLRASPETIWNYFCR
ncbi:MAG: hypothetical protein JNJ42_16125 [Burkholderiaceae bacterium]|jgi:hypothetical protein|nr:hypothetical protein [Burkholderiaceae bacterium]